MATLATIDNEYAVTARTKLNDNFAALNAELATKVTTDAALTALAAGSDFVQFAGPAVLPAGVDPSRVWPVDETIPPGTERVGWYLENGTVKPKLQKKSLWRRLLS